MSNKGFLFSTKKNDISSLQKKDNISEIHVPDYYLSNLWHHKVDMECTDYLENLCNIFKKSQVLISDIKSTLLRAYITKMVKICYSQYMRVKMIEVFSPLTVYALDKECVKYVNDAMDYKINEGKAQDERMVVFNSNMAVL